MFRVHCNPSLNPVKFHLSHQSYRRNRQKLLIECLILTHSKEQRERFECGKKKWKNNKKGPTASSHSQTWLFS